MTGTEGRKEVREASLLPYAEHHVLQCNVSVDQQASDKPVYGLSVRLPLFCRMSL